MERRTAEGPAHPADAAAGAAGRDLAPDTAGDDRAMLLEFKQSLAQLRADVDALSSKRSTAACAAWGFMH
jgi:hypothetical protein